MKPKYIKVVTSCNMEVNPYYSNNNRNIEPETMKVHRTTVDKYYYSDKDLVDSLSSGFRKDENIRYFKVEEIFPTITVSVDVKIDV